MKATNLFFGFNVKSIADEEKFALFFMVPEVMRYGQKK